MSLLKEKEDFLVPRETLEKLIVVLVEALDGEFAISNEELEKVDVPRLVIFDEREMDQLRLKVS